MSTTGARTGGRDTTITIVSPHPDDAALSLGVLISKSKDMKILIVNCYDITGYAPFGDMSSVKAVSKARAAEDEAFVRAVGAGHVRLRGLGELDAPLRLQTDDMEFIARDRMLDNGDLRHLVRLRRKLQRNVYGAVLLPLAVGSHIDHVMAFYAGLMLDRDRPTVAFYLDVPYWLEVSAAALRRRVAYAEDVLACRLFMYADDSRSDWDKARLCKIYPSQVAPAVAKRIAAYPYAAEVLVAPAGSVVASRLGCRRVGWARLRRW